MQRKQVIKNASMSVIQIILIALIYFVLYRYLLNTIGIEQFGIWSLVLATTSVTQIANFGLSGSVVKFVAKYLACGEHETVSKVIQTAVISITLFTGSILVVSYPAVKWILKLVIAPKSLHFAVSILPYALFSLWIMAITSIFQSGIDGYQRIDLRSILLVGGALFHLFLCFILVPIYGLIGLAYARVLHNLSVFMASWILLKKFLPHLPLFSYKWNKKTFKEIINYGLNFQIISIAYMFYGPITKALMSRFGGLSFVGYYEMASKLVGQCCNVILMANRVLVPTIASVVEKAHEKIQSIYANSYRLAIFITSSIFCLLIIFMPMISNLWIGRYEPIFVIFGTLLLIGYFLEITSATAYTAYTGIGILRWNVLGRLITALVNAGLGFLLGVFYGGIGVVIAWIIALGIGSFIISFSFHISHNIAIRKLLPKESKPLIILFLTLTISNLFVNQMYVSFFRNGNLTIVYAMTFFIISLILFWLHPMKNQLIAWVKDII